MNSFAHSRMAWVVWGIGVFAYAVAVMHRGALGVAGLEAAAHFGTTAGVVSTFVVLQLAVYAVAQVPVGAMLDRFGSRAIITTGSLITGVAQVLLAVVDDLPLAYLARILLGIGDACIFNSVLRLLPRWFTPRAVPVLSQVTGMAGAVGQIAAVGLVLPLIQHLGWTQGLLVATISSAIAASMALLGIRDAPPGQEASTVADSWREMPRQVAGVLKHPATQLGFWIHFTCGFTYNTFVFMWGMPYLVISQGLTQPVAGVLFTLLSVAGMVAGPIIGTLTARHPLRRSTLALLVVGALVVTWTAVLLWPGRAPLALLVLLVLVIAVGGPGTGIGFDFPRTSLPHTRLGAANGVVIAGSFTGSTVLILLMGVFLDLISGGRGSYTADELRLAWTLQAPFFIVGVAGILTTRNALRRRMADDGVIVPTWREVADRIRRSRS
ncbi:MFS transporter [Tessaracoccus palaemonis]|uniref:MFS transporter n=1 Tax=Tessaracoccus palaemonis TaxID=2829499 RepID=A0ABX8SIA2_9ACTN|nr:MFS transporter [Tessaracoccus palaemonis]QXT62709.1 MFS transporter [Tessaracoccus palaemonis]